MATRDEIAATIGADAAYPISELPQRLAGAGPAAVDLVLHQVVRRVLHHDVDQVHHAALPHRSTDGFQLMTMTVT